ncbi:phosphoglucomutase (alpha-D-glucose-1,6-bisphosphate-dependent) [Myxococcota bacterium]|nr:phosphoglucomutase (alpha-D-glucose-1,6-bisphosphate-dependent) [Myxococcota bacterium]
MPLHPRAGQPAQFEDLTDIPQLISAFFTRAPRPCQPEECVSFGTSGHRGGALRGSFNEAHIVAITAALCERRALDGITGPIFLGKDTHALSEPALQVALEVLTAADIPVRLCEGYTPTPVISHAIIEWNRAHAAQADGIIITPSHNPPDDGGFKYNPPHGGPADDAITDWIEARANALLDGWRDIPRVPYPRALNADTVTRFDARPAYVEALDQIIDMEAIAASGLRIGVDPMGGAGLAYWGVIAERYGLNIEVVNPHPDPTFRAMCLDKDGKIRMDCSSPWAMSGLIALKDRFDIAFGNDADYDRHGIVTPSTGLLNPNDYLAVAIDHLFKTRAWGAQVAVGKTLVSSGLIDRVAARLKRQIVEVPVGFKWFVKGFSTGTLGFGGEESAGASFLRRDGAVWTTDKDGIIMDLLAAEITATTGRDPGAYAAALRAELGAPIYRRADAAADATAKAKLKALSPAQIRADALAGEPILQRLTHAPGNGAAIGGLKIVTENGWFAARPSGTEAIYKIYMESFKDEAHLDQIHAEAQAIVDEALRG